MVQKYGHLANAEKFEVRPCAICDEPAPTYSWTDYSGEGTCCRCGTPYQLKWGELADGETYPRLNIAEEYVPLLRRFFAETGMLNGTGTYMSFSEYPEQRDGRARLDAWAEEHSAEWGKAREACEARIVKERGAL